MNLYRWALIFAFTGFLTACITTPDEVVKAPIHVALTTGNTEEVQRLAGDWKQLAALNEYGETPLLYSVKRSKTALVEILLEKGADPNTPNPRSGETPLIAAVRNSDTPMVKRLLGAGADLDRTDNEGSSPLTWAVRKGSLDLVKIISAQTGTLKIKKNPSLILEAAAYGHNEAVDHFLAIGAPPDVRSGRGETPLILAARFGHPETVQLLLENGSDVSAVDTDRASALTWAARMGRSDIVPLLAGTGADLNHSDSTSLTPLSHAVRLGHEQVVKYLLKEGADIKVSLPTGENMMYWASFQEGITRELLSYGAVPKRVSDGSDKPILAALRYLWLGKFYESELHGTPEQENGTVKSMLNCYQWAAEFFDMAAVVNDEAVEALRKKQAAADRMAVFLSLVSVANAQMQAQMQANQMAEIGALSNPGSTATGYGSAIYYTPAAFKKTHTAGIPGYQEAAAKCRESADGCRKILECYRKGKATSGTTKTCAENAQAGIQHLR